MMTNRTIRLSAGTGVRGVEAEHQKLIRAIDAAEDERHEVTWITDAEGNRLAAIVPVSLGERIEAVVPPHPNPALLPREVVVRYKRGGFAEYRTKSGRLLSDAEVAALAAEERAMRKPKANRFSHGDIDWWLPNLGQRVDALAATPKVNVARLAAVVDSLIAVGVLHPYQIGLPYKLAESADRQAAIEKWLTS